LGDGLWMGRDASAYYGEGANGCQSEGSRLDFL